MIIPIGHRVIPTKAGIHPDMYTETWWVITQWIPAFAGMTVVARGLTVLYTIYLYLFIMREPWH